MTARTTFLTLTGLALGGFAATHAAAADYGISFRYSSYTPSCYSSRYYSSYYPQSYVYYDDYRNYCRPVVYLGSTTPRVMVYDDCYPTTYRTTYTRSDRYTRPVRHARASVHYRSGQRTRHYRTGQTYRHPYRRTATYRRHNATPRISTRDYTSHYGGSRCRPNDSLSRFRSSLRGYRDGHRSSRYSHHRTPRVRIIRR